jgi:hypothetical protein
MTAPRRIKAGPITLASGLILGGVVLLLYNFGVIPGLTWLWKLAPLLLVGIGVEYFLKRLLNHDPETEVRFSIASLLLIIVLILVGGAIYTTGVFGGAAGSFLGSLGQPYTRTWDSQPLEVKDGDQLLVDNPFGRIDLLPATGAALSVRALIRSPESGPAREQADRASVEVDRSGNQVLVRVPSLSPNISYDLEIKVPVKMDANVTSSAGAVTAADLQGDLDVEGGMGKIDLERIAGNISVREAAGLVRVLEPGSNVTINSNAGSLEFSSNHPLAGRYDLETNTGKISFDIPAVSDLAVKAASDTGKIIVSGFDGQEPLMNGTGSTFDATLGSGKGQASLQVNAGSIRIAAH